MPDKADARGGPPVAPSRAERSRKEDPPSARPTARGRLKLKPPAEPVAIADGPRRRGPTKPTGEEIAPRSVGRKKAKPTDAGGSRQPRSKAPAREDQVPRQPPRGGGRGAEPSGYVRFRVRVEDGEMSVIASHLVDSELTLPSALHGEYAYEVSNGN